MNKSLAFFFLLIIFHGNAQHQDKVDFIHGEVFIEPIPAQKKIDGTVVYEFKVLQNVDSVFLDAKNMKFSAVRLNGKKVNYRNTGKIIAIKSKLKKGRSYQLKLDYSTIPKQTVYFLGWNDKDSQPVTSSGVEKQIWTQGQGKYTSHWLPSFDDMQEKIEFDLNITTDESYRVIANGKLEATSKEEPKHTMWQFDMENPMSSYLLAFAMGNYEKQKLKSKSGIPIENYYYPQDSLKVEPTYRYTKRIFDFLEAEIGVPYPWQNYKQIPVHDFLYAGMENTTATIFSDRYVIDSTAFVDKNYVNVNAHELAHQWFGNLVTEKDGNHHWLHEGFATYYAYLVEKEIFGEDHFYWKLYTSAVQLKDLIDRREGQSLTDPNASSLVFYEKGALALFVLRDLVGDRNFRNGIKNYLEKHKFKNVTISDFIQEMELSSGKDLSSFRSVWLENDSLPFEELKSILSTSSESLSLLFAMENEFQQIQSDDLDYENYWDKTNSIHLKRHIVEKYHRILPKTIIEKAFASDTVQIRQALAKYLDTISVDIKPQFESLLEDKSYVTVENTLFKLWLTFPDNRKEYLSKTEKIIGLPNKNVRLLWLTLAILTNDYNSRETNNYFQELSSYSSPKYSWEIRMGAFQYLDEAIGLNDESLKNLMNGTVHHSWQFRKYTRNLLDKILLDPDYKLRIQNLSKELNGDVLRYINTKLKQ